MLSLVDAGPTSFRAQPHLAQPHLTAIIRSEGALLTCGSDEQLLGHGEGVIELQVLLYAWS